MLKISLREAKMKAIQRSENAKFYKLFIAIYLSLATVVSGYVLVTLHLTPDLQQVMVVILGLLILATLDAFRKCLDDAESQSYVGTYVNELKQTFFEGNVGYYAGGNLTYVGDTNTSNQLNIPPNYFEVLKTIELVPDPPNRDQPGVKDALVRLQAYIESEPKLTIEEKIEALEQVKTLAEAAQNPTQDKKLMVQKALKALSGETASTNSVVETILKLIPGFLGF